MAGGRDYGSRSLDRATRNGAITPRDRDLIREFCDELEATKGISQRRRDKLTSSLVTWRRFIGPFDEVGTAGLHKGIRAMKAGRPRLSFAVERELLHYSS
jgi:hypothetical protein